jgi:hypothetical protein
VGEQVDADPELGELARLLEDFDIDTGFVKAQSGGKTADSGTHNDDSHVKARAYVPCSHPCAAVGICGRSVFRVTVALRCPEKLKGWTG